MPRLVRAINECYNCHFPENPPLTLDDLQSEVRELSVWPSNCMIAWQGEDPIAVSIATKREREVLVQRVGVRPGCQRQGHGRHLVTSLSQKLAVLGPSRLIAEIPKGWEVSTAFLKACGYQPETVYADFVLEAPLPPIQSPGAIIPVTVQELLDNGLLGSEADQKQDCSWQRQTTTLLQRKDELSGLAIASPDCIEAFFLQRRCPGRGGSEIVRLGVQDENHGELFLSLLLRAVSSAEAFPVHFPRLSPSEFGFAHLESLGLRPVGNSIRYAATAKPL